MLGSSVKIAPTGNLGGTVVLSFNDDIALSFGSSSDASFIWETADANANALILALPEGGDTNVPIFVIGDASISNADLTFFNGITEPSIAIVDDDKSAYLLVGFYANDQPALRSANSITLMPSGDVDDYFTFAIASNIPTIYGTGAYVRIGDAAASGYGLTSEDDLMVTGKLEVTGLCVFDGGVKIPDNVQLLFGTSSDAVLRFQVTDANANEFLCMLPNGDSTNVTALVITGSAIPSYDLGLFDGVTQPLVSVLEKAGTLHSCADGVADAGGATAILKKTAGFTAAVIGDIVRITAGTNCTAGWYWITTVTSADQVTLDRNYASNNSTNVTFVTYHNFPMIGADGVKVKVFDGAPGDANTEIDIDGWVHLDVSQANGRLYWRANNAYHYVDATAGFGVPVDETNCPVCGEPILVGQAVGGQINQKLSDNSLHGLWCHLSCLN